MTRTSRVLRQVAGAAVAVAVVLTSAACGRTNGQAAQAVPVLDGGGDFSLIDHDGKPFSLASQRGKVVLVFFGYTFCPDACPTTLSKLASVYRKLGDDAARVKTLYISVDPERDTPEVLKADLSNFRIDAIGLTGVKADIDKVVQQYGAAYEIVPTPDSAAKYTVSHTTTLYALDPSGRIRMKFRYEASVDEVTDGIRAVIAAS
ncbi:MAG: SCO family protein [Vicinamibacterales bacterium]